MRSRTGFTRRLLLRLALRRWALLTRGGVATFVVVTATEQLHERFEITHATLQVVNAPFTQPCGDWQAGPDRHHPPLHRSRDGCGHDHGHHHDHAHGARGHAHEDDIKGISLSLDRPMDGTKFTAWLDRLLGEQGQNILRAMGIIDVDGEDRRLVFQAVHMILEGDLQREWGANERRWSRAVFIGRDLDEAALKAGFEACAA